MSNTFSNKSKPACTLNSTGAKNLPLNFMHFVIQKLAHITQNLHKITSKLKQRNLLVSISRAI